MNMAACQEDLHYKAAWEAQLNKQEKDRLDRLARTKAQQERTAAFAASVTLTENKRWMDPALTEKQRQEREAKLEKQEAERKLRVRQSGLEVAKRLEEQIREKEAAQQAVRMADELKAQAVVQRAVAEEEREQARRTAREAEKLRFRLELEAQMKDNVAKKRNGTSDSSSSTGAWSLHCKE
ncbi:uncharacterized protein HaLaN_02862 [Haematococcus lacustris]|uniref:Trichohyalin-plectin-homology domain-containing protein n=1 Tax=Haematococcus lacustris TaxID=44745 RepID=A0A699YCM8_HAELA|nr:uncharacterized protein HaLaN_02862 [Haematococcus lacustris]